MNAQLSTVAVKLLALAADAWAKGDIASAERLFDGVWAMVGTSDLIDGMEETQKDTRSGP